MNYSVDTSVQLRAVIKALRKTRGLSQTGLGRILGVNQKRIAKIEADPGVTSWSQIARMVSALGGRLTIQDTAANEVTSAGSETGKGKGRTQNKAAW